MFPIVINPGKQRLYDFEFGAPIKAKKKAPAKKAPAKKPTLTADSSRGMTVKRNVATGGGVAIGGSIPVDSSVTPTFMKQPTPVRGTSWYEKGLDFLLTREQINAEVAKVQATAGQSGQNLTNDQAMQQVAQNFNVPQPGGSVGSGIGSGIDGVFQWAMANPIIPIGSAIMLFLLFRQPPGSGRR